MLVQRRRRLPNIQPTLGLQLLEQGAPGPWLFVNNIVLVYLQISRLLTIITAYDFMTSSR